jgi:hypothetical protein
MNNLCSIFFYEGYVCVAPTIINLAKSLNNHGYSVKIYATKTQFTNVEKIGDNTTVTYFKKASDIPLISRILLIFYYKLKIKAKIPLIELIVFAHHSFINTFKTINSKSLKNNISIGVDTNGSILALFESCFFKHKFVYLSLELNDPNNLKGLAKIINLLERLAYRKSECVIIQDEDRFKTLCEYNQYQHPQVFYLPNSSSSSEALVEEPQSKNYFREKFNLNEEKFSSIILQAGAIEDAVLSKELAQAFASVNNKCALVFHERQKREVDDPYMKLLQEINSKNLFLSLEPVAYEQIDRIYTSATIGLAFYKDINNNYSQISMASGKLSYYLKHSKPVIVNNLQSLARLIEKYKIGVVIQDPLNPLEIELAIERILSNYSFYSKNARICFDEEFDFAKKINPILSFIESL